MPEWKTRIDVREAWAKRAEGLITIQDLATAFASELGRIKWPGVMDIDRTDLIWEFEDMAKDADLLIDDFDDVLHQLYDLADREVAHPPTGSIGSIWAPKLCWVATTF